MINENALEVEIIKNLESITKVLKEEYYNWIKSGSSNTIRLDGLNYKEKTKEIEKIRNTDEFEFVGNQVRLGTKLCDLLFKVNYKAEDIDDYLNVITVDRYDFIVVELKNRELKLRDLGQVSMYINLLELIDKDSYTNILGVLIGEKMSESLVDFVMCNDIPNISLIEFGLDISFSINPKSYSYNENFIENFTYDERLK